MAGIPLLSTWRLVGDLPGALLQDIAPASLALPGAKALEGFASLLGIDQDEPAQADSPPQDSAAFPLPAMLPDAMSGPCELCTDIDFGRLRGDHAMLTFDALCGAGDVLLDGEKIASFGDSLYAGPMALVPCALALDLTAALHLGRRQTLTLRFGDARPAGVPGPVALRITRDAFLRRIDVIPQAADRTMLVRAEVYADREGLYVLEARPDTPQADAVSASLRIGERMPREIELIVPTPGELFSPGQPHAAPTLKFTLYRRSTPTAHRNVPGKRGFSLLAKKQAAQQPAFATMKGTLCDSAALMCGYPGSALRAWVPLSIEDCAAPAAALTDRLTRMGITGVSLPRPASDALYRALTRAGIGVRQCGAQDGPLQAILARYPCLSFAAAPSAALSPAMAAWQLGGVVGQIRHADADATERELLEDAFGQSVDPDAQRIADVLHWLQAVHVRLLCEASRQMHYTGALCGPDQWHQPDIANALEAALAATHVSALPLLGAWWAGSLFSASICACIGERYGGELTVLASLENESGATLATRRFGCPPGGGMLGLLEARLPDQPCALTLHTRLLSGKTTVEESALPIYVGRRGPLEAALT